MTIDQAIEILKDHSELILVNKNPDLNSSIKLGIEALKEVEKARHGDPALDGELLPSETVN